jgi:hypothetical protein
MYYIGELSKGNRHEILVELWNDTPYTSFSQARQKIKEIEKDIGKSNLEPIDERDYDIPYSQRWSE